MIAEIVSEERRGRASLGGAKDEEAEEEEAGCDRVDDKGDGSET